MADYSFEDLKGMTVAQLREVAAGIDHPAVQGYTQKHKDEIVQDICTALNIEMHVHHDIVGIDKKKVRARIKELKAKRDAALEAKDHAELKKARREIHHLKRKMRRAMV